MNKHLPSVDSFKDIMNIPMLSGWDELFKEGGIFQPMRSFVASQGIKVDVIEADKAYSVKAELPGVNKEDIKVSVYGNQVIISCDVKKQTEEKQGEKVIRSERYSGQLYRNFTLAHEINDKETTAKYHDGVLELYLPKKADAAGVKEIPIS
jgi:HSP20 family protein